VSSRDMFGNDAEMIVRQEPIIAIVDGPHQAGLRPVLMIGHRSPSAASGHHWKTP
jgi:hypothetical protein